MTKTLTALGAYDINTNDPRFSKSHNVSLKQIFRILFSINSFYRDLAEISVLNDAERERVVNSAKHFKRKSFVIMTTLNKI